MTSLAMDLQPICWEAIECALVEWIEDKLGYSEDQILWENTDLPQPSYPYISLNRIAGPTREGGIDETRVSEDLSMLGEEIELLTTGPREFTISISAHVDRCSGGHEAQTNASALLGRLEASTDQISTRDRFSAAGFGVIEPLPITDTSLEVNAETLSRATFDVRFRTASVMTERLGYIDKVELKSDELGVNTIIDAS